MALKKTTSLTLVAVSILILVIAVLAFNAMNESRERELQEKESALQQEQAMNAVLGQLADIERYQRFCLPAGRQGSSSVLRVEAAGDFVKLISASGGPEEYFKGATSTPCTRRTSSTDCTLIRGLAFGQAYSCPNETVAAATNEKNGIQVKTQETGTAVILDVVILERPGFAVVRSVDRAGNPGEVLASSALLQPGVSRIVSIAMPEALRVGQKYAAAIALDDGNGSFEADTDMLLTRADGSALFAVFTAVKK